jgi:hypothetical protein
MEHRTLIDRLGGYQKLAEKLGCNPVTAWRWQYNGIPPRHWLAVVELARAAGIRGVSVGALQRASPLYGIGEPRQEAV